LDASPDAFPDAVLPDHQDRPDASAHGPASAVPGPDDPVPDKLAGPVSDLPADASAHPAAGKAAVLRMLDSADAAAKVSLPDPVSAEPPAVAPAVLLKVDSERMARPVPVRANAVPPVRP
jgi:hypothetical protein